MSSGDARTRWVRGVLASVLAAALMAGCTGSGRVDPSARVVRLPGVSGDVDFDDITYSAALGRMLVPARDHGLYLVEPDTAEVTSVPLPSPLRSADSADADDARVFLVDRKTRTLAVLDPKSGRLLGSVGVGSSPDYMRYLPAVGEVWVTEPAADGIEVFTVADRTAAAPRRAGFIPVPGGPEGLTIGRVNGAATAFTHAGSDLVAVDIRSHQTQRWPTGCDGTHGFPRVDERDGLVLASCADDGRIVLLNARTGDRLGDYKVGGGDSLPAWSPRAGHFYVRSDPGTRLATLDPSRDGVTPLRDVEVPSGGHCMGADNQGHYWTCDAARGRLLRFDDPG